jgi:putative DNA primase/helicase
MESLSSPVRAFVRDCCIVEANGKVDVKVLYHEWQDWCRSKGRKEPGTEQMFGRELWAAVSSLSILQERDKSTGERKRIYTGIRRRNAFDQEAND